MKQMIAQLQNQIAFQPQPSIDSQPPNMEGTEIVSVTSKQIDATQLEASVSALSKPLLRSPAEVASSSHKVIPRLSQLPPKQVLPKKPSTLARRQLKIVNGQKQD